MDPAPCDANWQPSAAHHTKYSQTRNIPQDSSMLAVEDSFSLKMVAQMM